MPRGNRMGPQGQGPMTSRGAGFCAGFGGRGFGFGFQQRMRGSIPTEMTAESEKAFLQNRIAILARELEDANKRLAELNDQ